MEFIKIVKKFAAIFVPIMVLFSIHRIFTDYSGIHILLLLMWCGIFAWYIHLGVYKKDTWE